MSKGNKDYSSLFPHSLEEAIHSIFGSTKIAASREKESVAQPNSGSSKPKINRAKIATANRIISDFYRLQAENELSHTIKACYLSWMAIRMRQEDGHKAKSVLDAFYQSGKILDLLQQFSTYANQLEKTSSLEIARMKGYCNYLFYVESQVSKLTQTYTLLPKMELPAPEQIDPQSVADFLQKECGSLSFVQRLQTAQEIAQSLQQKERFFKSDYDNYLLLIKNINQRNQLTDEDRQALNSLQTALEQQFTAISDNIQRANQICMLLQELLPQSWFDSMNYELDSCPISNMDLAEIKTYYEEHMREVRAKLLEPYGKEYKGEN